VRRGDSGQRRLDNDEYDQLLADGTLTVAAPRAITIDLLADELSVLLVDQGHDLPEWMAAELAAGRVGSRAAAKASARRSLWGRGLVAESGQVIDPVLQLLRFITSPELILRLRGTGPDHPSLVFMCSPEVSVEHGQLSGVHRFVVLPTEDLLLHVGQAASLSTQGAAAGPAFTAPGDLLSELVRAPDPPTVRRLSAAGVPAEPAAQFARALLTAGGAQSLESTWLSSPRIAVGGELAWVNGGDDGIWQLDAGVVLGGGHHDAVVTPISAQDLLSELRSYLPGQAAT
jgi:hypothetical protein